MSSHDLPDADPVFVRDFLAQTLPFRFLDSTMLMTLAKQCTIDFYPRQTIVIEQGQAVVDALYLIQRGGVRLFVRDDEGTVTLLDFRGEGTTFGATAIFRHGSSDVCVETIEDTFVIKLHKQTFLDIAETQPVIANYYLKVLSRDYLSKAFVEMRRRKSFIREEGSFYLFSKRVGDVVSRPAVTVDFGRSIQRAARDMLKQNVGSLLVREPSGAVSGIVTDKDLRMALALGIDSSAGVETIMSTPVASIESHHVCFDALLKMMTGQIHHLSVTRNGDVIGVLTSHDIMVLQGKSPMSLFREIRSRERLDELYPMAEKVPQMVRNLVEEGAKAGNITRMIAIINDLIVERVLHLVSQEIGPAPVSYCFLFMGSEGRREQTFATDQDNALVYADCEEDFLERAANIYFEAFSQRVTEELVKCGYPRCNGEIMASNPAWRNSLSAWKRIFDDWVHVPHPQDVMHASIFFDFRGGHGHVALAEDLRRHVIALTRENDVFLRYLAQDCLKSRPPLSFFNNFIVEKDGEHRNTLDIKARGLLPLTDFARVLALHAGISETGTLLRLQLVHEKGLLPDDLYQASTEAFEFLLHLRLVHQLERVEQGVPPNNHIEPSRLSELEKRTLKQAFAVIGRIQAHVNDAYHLSLS